MREVFRIVRQRDHFVTLLVAMLITLLITYLTVCLAVAQPSQSPDTDEPLRGQFRDNFASKIIALQMTISGNSFSCHDFLAEARRLL